MEQTENMLENKRSKSLIKLLRLYRKIDLDNPTILNQLEEIYGESFTEDEIMMFMQKIPREE